MTTRVLVAGGYGVFGSQISKELALSGVPLTIAGRSGETAEKFARGLGKGCRGIALDIRDQAACSEAFAGHAVVVHCAGPFRPEDAAAAEACLAARSHYIDIADDRTYTAMIRSLDTRFRNSDLTAIFGCSSLPGLSGALAERLRSDWKGPPARIRVTLFIGNRNPKGEAAVRSVFRILGENIRAPQGTIRGFGDPEKVLLPAPWGRRAVYNFESPEYDLFPSFGATAVSVKIGFEKKTVGRLFALLTKLPKSWRGAALKPAVAIGNAFRRGSSGGAVVVEFFDGAFEAPKSRAVLYAPESGQRMAILPAVFAVKKLLSEGSEKILGVKTAYEFLGTEILLEGLKSEGLLLL